MSLRCMEEQQFSAPVFTIEELIDKDYDYLRYCLPSVSLRWSDTIDPFLEKYYSIYGKDMFFVPQMVPSYCEYTSKSSQYKNKFAIIEHCGTRIMVFLRIMDSVGLRKTGKNPYFQMFWPISENGNFCLEEIVFSELTKISCIKTVVTPVCSPSVKPMNYNFYGTSEDLSRLSTNKFMKKHMVSKISGLIDTKIYRLSDVPENVSSDISRLCHDWYDFRLHSKEKQHEEERILHSNAKSNRIVVMVFLYEGKVIAYSFITVYDRFAISSVTKHIATLGREYIASIVGEGIANEMWHGLGLYVAKKKLEYVIEDCGCEAMYALGLVISKEISVMKQQGNIFSTKSDTYSGCVTYYNIYTDGDLTHIVEKHRETSGS